MSIVKVASNRSVLVKNQIQDNLCAKPMVTLGLWHYRSKDFQRMCFHFLDEIRGYVCRVEVRICIGKDINKHSLKTVIDGIRSYYVPWFVYEAVPSMWWVKRCCIHFWCMDLLCQFSQGFSSLVMLWMERSLLHPKICELLAPVVTLGFQGYKGKTSIAWKWIQGRKKVAILCWEYWFSQWNTIVSGSFFFWERCKT